MSDSFELIRELLPLGSALQDDGNPLRIVLDRSVGEWLDGFEQPFDELFLTTATGGWLDAHGRQYGVPRKLDETDEDYRQRIVYEMLDELTPLLLADVYGVKLFSLVDDFNVYGNSLVSDNPYLGSDGFMGVADDTVISILDKKFILGTGVTWVSDFGELEYILNSRGMNVLSDYSRVYTLSDLVLYFRNNAGIVEVKLTLPTATRSNSMFRSCSALTSVDLSLPNATDCTGMFEGCSALTDVKLNMPNLSYHGSSMFYNCSNLETIDVTLPANKVSGFKSYVTGLNLQHLTSFIINGEEQL